MPLSLNPNDILKLFLDNKSRERERIEEYLESIALEAASLAKVWREVYEELAKGECDVYQNRKILEELERAWKIQTRYPQLRNVHYYYRLADFYDSVSTVLGGRLDKNWQENFVYHLGKLLRARNITKQRYEQAVRSIKNQFLFDTENSINDLLDLNRSVEVLNREAAALEILAKNFRAMKS